MIVCIDVQMTSQKSALLGLVITVGGVVSSRSPFFAHANEVVSIPGGSTSLLLNSVQIIRLPFQKPPTDGF